jgi:hypothetical protein
LSIFRTVLQKQYASTYRFLCSNRTFTALVGESKTDYQFLTAAAVSEVVKIVMYYAQLDLVLVAAIIEQLRF